jgi:hypothetical protein
VLIDVATGGLDLDFSDENGEGGHVWSGGGGVPLRCPYCNPWGTP